MPILFDAQSGAGNDNDLADEDLPTGALALRLCAGALAERCRPRVAVAVDVADAVVRERVATHSLELKVVSAGAELLELLSALDHHGREVDFVVGAGADDLLSQLLDSDACRRAVALLVGDIDAGRSHPKLARLVPALLPGVALAVIDVRAAR